MEKVIYIVGPMKNDPDYEKKFDAAESYLSWKGWTVLNPACLPQGLKGNAYMPICMAMIDAADAVCLLKDSHMSAGASVEEKYAEYQGKTIFRGIEGVPTLDE